MVIKPNQMPKTEPRLKIIINMDAGQVYKQVVAFRKANTILQEHWTVTPVQEMVQGPAAGLVEGATTPLAAQPMFMPLLSVAIEYEAIVPEITEGEPEPGQLAETTEGNE